MTHRLDIFFKGIFVANLSECRIPEEVTNMLESVPFPEPETVVGEVMRIIDCRFHNIFSKELQDQEKAITYEESEIDFVTFVVPFCLELCKETSYPSFLLMCAFFKEVIFQALMSQCCYRVLYLSYKCLAYIYVKRFRKLLPPERGLDELTSFCSYIIENKEIMDDILPFQSTVELLENCKSGENRLVFNDDDIITVLSELWWKVENSSDEELKGAIGPAVVPDCTAYSLPRECESQNVNMQNTTAASKAIHCVSRRRLEVVGSIARNVKNDMESWNRDRQNSPGTNKCLLEGYPNKPGPSRTSDQNYQNLPGPSQSSCSSQGTFGSITNIFSESEARNAYTYWKSWKGHNICGFCDTNCFAFLYVVNQFKNCA